jgi:3-dehydroquinate synthetase
MDLMSHDKKFIAGRNRFVLASGIGRVKVVESIPTDMITLAIKAVF